MKPPRLDFVLLLKTLYLSQLVVIRFWSLKNQINENFNRLEVPKIAIAKAAPCGHLLKLDVGTYNFCLT